MSSPSPSLLDSMGNSPLGSVSDPLENPLLALEMALGPLVGYGDSDRGFSSRKNNAGFNYSPLMNSSAFSLYLNEAVGTTSSLGSLSDKDSGNMRSSADMIGCSSSSSSSGVSSPGVATKCVTCGTGDSISILPKVLACLHALCQSCWDKQQLDNSSACCPVCKTEGLLTSETSTTDFSASSTPTCSSCRMLESNPAVAKCIDCMNFLCPVCVVAHQLTQTFDGHRLLTLSELSCNRPTSVSCDQHPGETLNLYCHSCNSPACNQCLMQDHSGPIHDVEPLNEAAARLGIQMTCSLNDARDKAAELRSAFQNSEAAIKKMALQLNKLQLDINDTYHKYLAALEERREDLLRDAENIFAARKVYLRELDKKSMRIADRIARTCDFVDRLGKSATPLEMALFRKALDAKLGSMNVEQHANVNFSDLEFVSNHRAIQTAISDSFGSIRPAAATGSAFGGSSSRQPPIARPANPSSSSTFGGFSSGGFGSGFDSGLLAKRYATPSTTTNSFGLGLNDMGIAPSFSSAWNNSNSFDSFSGMNPISSSILDPTEATPFDASKVVGSSLFPLRSSQIKRSKMVYHCKFGEFGVMEGQFTEPSGVAVNAQNDIIVADTNNHRIQIFDKDGRFKFQFGECGKRDGQLLYPNRVAVVKTTGDIVVTERSPTHQIQIYNQYGQFVRKFGANVLQHPRGVTVDNKGRIIVVECKVMRVIIFDQMGNVLHKFGCSKYLEFPNGVVVNDKQEIFISDNRAHCVKVFNYEGVFLRQIGGEGLTNYPIGVGINAAGEILIADNHNNFNITVFTQDGQLVSALESKVKHAQCFDVTLLDDDSVVMASKDYRLYVYRYAQVPSLALQI